MQMWYLLHICCNLATLVNPFFRPVNSLVSSKVEFRREASAIPYTFAMMQDNGCLYTRLLSKT